ncbi:MAG: DNA-binding transcriptional regulator [Planctomycetaceae bacterium]|nr:DNA-binding transcriptional regulator [Planctomycetaceae bacterium]
MPAGRRVALLIETSSSYGRELLRGIIRYMRAHEEWSVFLEERALNSELPTWLADWHGDGIISRTITRWLADSVARAGTPLVNLIDREQLAGIPSVSSDQEAIGRLGAEHLLERGYERFAFCGFAGEGWSDGRLAGFLASLRERGHTAVLHESVWKGSEAPAWDEEQQAIGRWVDSLETPCGIMACNDIRAQQVLDACRIREIAVPDSIAVIGVDNDELLCQLSSPPLSSVIPNTEEIGYLAADLLARMMNGEEVARAEVRVAPVGVATRLSTDSVAIEDIEMAAAVRYIRENACRGISVREVLKQVPVSRSALERGFRKHLGRSPQQEIRNVQIKRCETLLKETDLPMDRIASMCGFQHPEYMHVVFKRERGITPGQFRRTADE